MSPQDFSTLSERSDRQGILLMVAASLSFSVMGIFAKLALVATGVWELVFFRGLVTTIIMFFLVQSDRPFSFRRHSTSRSGPPSPTLTFRWSRLRGRDMKLLIARGVFGSLGLVCFMYGIAHLKLADAVILNRVSPIFVILLAPLALKEKITPAHLVVVAAALFGVYHIVKPDLDIQLVPGLIGLISAVFAALAYVSIKKLTADHPPLLIVFYFALVSTLLPIPFLFQSFTLPTPSILMDLLAVGLTAALAQVLMTLSYRQAPASKVSIASYTNVVFAALWGYLFFGELQDTRSLIGSTIIVGCCLLLPFVGRRKTGKIPPPSR